MADQELVAAFVEALKQVRGSDQQNDLVTVQQSGVKYLGALVLAIQTIFPQQTGTSATATAGAATLPANPVGFIVVSLPDGTSVKVPYYAS